MNPNNSLEKLFEIIRQSQYLSVYHNEAAKALGVSIEALNKTIAGSEALEIVQRTSKAGKPFKVVRVSCTVEGLARLAPIPVSVLKTQYGFSEQDLARLKIMVDTGVQAGRFHIKEEVLQPGAGDSCGVNWQRESPSIKKMDYSLALYELEPMSPEELKKDLEVLNTLEDLEARRINFSLYATFVSAEEILNELRKKGWQIVAQELHTCLDRLVRHKYVLELGNQHYRSRISEHVCPFSIKRELPVAARQKL